MENRILCVQFTDPSHYPPLEHLSQLLAERGWLVTLFGTGSFGDNIIEMPKDARITIHKLPAVRSRWRQKLQYLEFIFRGFVASVLLKPQWIYASDPLSAPLALLLAQLTGARIVYHEHDAPNLHVQTSSLMKFAIACRNRLARIASICVIPQSDRLGLFLAQTGRKGPTYCVWNCPRVTEIQNQAPRQDPKLVVYYHGSINSARLPPQLIEAACRFKGIVQVRVAGYETAGSRGYVDELMRLAVEKGCPSAMKWLGTISLRHDLLQMAAQADVGISLMPAASDDVNMIHMVGASNKPFDYMASGLPLLVSDLPAWTSLFVTQGFARACRPYDVDSIESQLRWFLEHPDERRAMSERCREQIRKSWNYESMARDVIAAIDERRAA
jgi:glycosyltransferase involved in cell wall biosynthesis